MRARKIKEEKVGCMYVCVCVSVCLKEWDIKKNVIYVAERERKRERLIDA